MRIVEWMSKIMWQVVEVNTTNHKCVLADALNNGNNYKPCEVLKFFSIDTEMRDWLYNQVTRGSRCVQSLADWLFIQWLGSKCPITDWLFIQWFNQSKIQKTSPIRITGSLRGESICYGFPSQRASNMENVPMSGHYYQEEECQSIWVCVPYICSNKPKH